MASNKQLQLIREEDHVTFTDTKLDMIQLKLESVKEPLKLWNSKVGGKPYLPKDEDYPRNNDGAPLHLIAQINFAELPPLEHYPKTGILSFYLDLDDDVFGMDFDNQFNQSAFRVLFYENVMEDESQLTTDFSAIEDHRENCECEIMEGDKEFLLTGSLETMYISIGDYRFDELIGKSSYDYFTEMEEENHLPAGYDDVDKVYNDYANPFGECHHQIGGYPYFTQEDPRTEDDNVDILLFQLDSEYNKEANDFKVIWGDVGIANFFISKDDLIARQFDRVMFNWDCS